MFYDNTMSINVFNVPVSSTDNLSLMLVNEQFKEKRELIFLAGKYSRKDLMQAIKRYELYDEIPWDIYSWRLSSSIDLNSYQFDFSLGSVAHIQVCFNDREVGSNIFTIFLLEHEYEHIMANFSSIHKFMCICIDNNDLHCTAIKYSNSINDSTVWG